MEDLKTALASLLKDAALVEGRRGAVQTQIKNISDKISLLEEDLRILDLVSDLFRVLIDKEVLDNVRAAQDLLSEGLRAIFDDLDISVRADVDVQRGKVSVDLMTIQHDKNQGTTEGSSIDAYGGSISTVQSVLLRIVVIHRRGLRPLLLLDESLAAVAEHYVPRVGRFLSTLASRLHMDILAVTHSSVLVESADKAYRIQKKDGTATFKEIRV